MSEAAVFRALADPNRREMLSLLSEGPRTSSEIGAHFHMSAPAVSQHLKVLRDVGLVSVEKAGR